MPITPAPAEEFHFQYNDSVKSDTITSKYPSIPMYLPNPNFILIQSTQLILPIKTYKRFSSTSVQVYLPACII